MVGWAQTMRHALTQLDLVRSFRRNREIDYRLRGPIRADCYGILCSAALAERGDNPTFLRVVDLHPWVAEPAETLAREDFWGEAVRAASDNVRTEWRSATSVRKRIGPEEGDEPLGCVRVIPGLSWSTSHAVRLFRPRSGSAGMA